MICLFPVAGWAQPSLTFSPSSPRSADYSPAHLPTFLLIVRYWSESAICSSGFSRSCSPGWVVLTEVYDSMADVLARLNGRYPPSLEPVALWKLDGATIPLALDVIQHEKTREVITEPWEERKWRLK
jgi:hypothetical protein